ncbi:carbohydrate ABC transporter permease [Cohnella silvisoli]|uniref:Carbohydrate ABC transporter permease n=1 Tax=Cohnella silvisoli TaxID=2873699 RepID=A0ABV1KME9_9BACL|nr:carbohydrate ABC transporter permease [Cohnella silvisoli]MCD9020672.1 carbohydrate ABC transporter permease [Cohnella silvisoli]
MKLLSRPLMFAVLIIYSGISLFPLINLLFQSFKPENEILAHPFTPPSGWTGEHFIKLWTTYEFNQYTLNSILITIVSLAAVIGFALMGAYALARIPFFGNRIHYAILLGTMLVPGSLLIVPVYVLSSKLHLLDSYAGLLLPYISGGIILPVILLKNVFESVPKDMMDAASIDGCGEYRMLFTVMMPLALPMIGTICILSYPGIWNEFVWAQVALNSNKLFTLPVAMARLASNAYSVGFGTVYAGMFFLTMPLILIFLIAQRSFISAVTEGAVKG